jgi:hypothetical protein
MPIPPSRQVIASLAGFGEFAADVTAVALRVLASAIHKDIAAALKARDYEAAERSAFELLKTLAELEKRKGRDG